MNMRTYSRLLLIAASIFAVSIGANAQMSANNLFFNDMGEIANNLSEGAREGVRPIEFVNPRFDDVIWSRIVYRIIDLREKMNFPLYFPEESSNGRQSMFTTLFRLLQEGKIKAFNPTLSGREDFSEKNLFDFDNFLQVNDIIHSVQTNPATGERMYVIDESDIPNRNVLKYYLKEVWYFDKNNSSYNVRPVAICPMLSVETDRGIETRPVCWIPFETLRPFFVQQEVMVTDRNTAALLNLDDLFIKRRFGSYIYKVASQTDRMILEYAHNLDEVKSEQARIKSEILDFEQDLWEY
jgi:gliding motility associated protien GldN